MKPCYRLIFFSLLVSFVSIPAQSADSTTPDLKPHLAQLGEVVLQEDFSEAGPVNKEHWGARQGTRWAIADGVLRGLPSTTDYQASKPDHNGFEPRVSAPVTPAEFVAKFSVRFTDGEESAIVPFVEFGHHVARLKFSSTDGLSLLVEGETVKAAEAKNFRYEPGNWYHVLAEMKGDELLVQFADGSTIYAKNASFLSPPTAGGIGLGVAGPKGGTVEIDNVTLWTIKADEQPGWAAKRAAFPVFEPVVVKEKKEKSKAK